MDIGRRNMLGAIGAAGVASVAGCCAVSRAVPPLLGQTPELPMRAWLKPTQIIKAPAAPNLAIDVHAHFFNASDVNVRGYFKDSIGHSFRPALRTLVELLSPFAETLAAAAMDAKTEYEEIVALGRLDEKSAIGEIELRTERHVERVDRAIFDILKGSEFAMEYERLYKLTVYRSGAVKSMPDTRFTLENVSRATARSAGRSVVAETKQLTRTADVPNPNDVIEFLGIFLRPRWMAISTYQNAYTSTRGAFGIDAVLGASVDFDHWFDCFPYSPREDQMRVQALLSLASGGYMLPLVAYNPWTDMIDKESSLGLVARAVEEYGFVGAKIYPPMGYYAYGNEKIDNASKRQRPTDLAKLDETLKRFFDYCTSMNVPVMAHTAESRGRDDPSDAFGGPDGWRELLAKYETAHKHPVIQAAHFGGLNTKKGKPHNWTTEFADLMRHKAATRFFADVGYWMDDADNSGKPCEGIRERAKCAFKENPVAASRVMFGSDWYMISQEEDWEAYPFKIASQLGSEISTAALFGKNAVECYGFAAHKRTEHEPSNRRRIENRFAGESKAPPAWLAKC
jgi:predicted TIM-barrel fold metal-dependent hydrolase